MTLSNETRAGIKRVFEPIALAMGRAGLTPDGLTLIGFAITAVGAILLAAQQWLIGGLVVFAGGAFDMFDGTLARATGKVSRLGAFMDSVFDRWGEAFVYLGIVIGVSGSAWGAVSLPWDAETSVPVLPGLAAFAMGSAFMVSYARAKSEGLGFTEGTGMAAVGLMPREIRLVILSVGLVAFGLTGGLCTPAECSGFAGSELWLVLALALIGIGATITVIQRIVHVRRLAAPASASQESR